MIASALPSSDFTSHAAVSYERSIEIGATLTTSRSGTEFTASVEISISLEARAVIQTQAISNDVNTLRNGQDDADERLGGVAENVLRVLSAVADRQINAQAGTKILDASETYRETIQDLLAELGERSLESRDINRLSRAEDTFNNASAAALGGSLSQAQEVLSNVVDRIAGKALKATRHILKGHDPSHEQARLIKHTEKALSHALDKIF